MLRTGKKYIDDVKGRATVFIGGERVDDITTHPALESHADPQTSATPSRTGGTSRA